MYVCLVSQRVIINCLFGADEMARPTLFAVGGPNTILPQIVYLYMWPVNWLAQETWGLQKVI